MNVIGQTIVLTFVFRRTIILYELKS